MSCQNSLHITLDDNTVRYPLGAASYVFRKDLVQTISRTCEHDIIKLRIGTQPNSSPRIGTIITFAIVFALAMRLQQFHPKKAISMYVDFIDTAPSMTEKIEINGVSYQKSLRYTGEVRTHIDGFRRILDRLS